MRPNSPTVLWIAPGALKVEDIGQGFSVIRSEPPVRKATKRTKPRTLIGHAFRLLGRLA